MLVSNLSRIKRFRPVLHGKEALNISRSYATNDPPGGHHGANLTAKKVFDAGFFWPSIYKDAHDWAKTVPLCRNKAEEQLSGLPNSIQNTPLVYSVQSLYMERHVIYIEFGSQSLLGLKNANIDLPNSRVINAKFQRNELSELLIKPMKNSLIYKEKTKRNSDAKIKNAFYNVGCPGFLKSLVLFVLQPQELHNPQLHLENPIPNLIDNVYLKAYFINGLRIYVETLRKTSRTMFHSSMGGSSI
ncbi:hypothetical protein Tco_0523599 [Tanacetum coccineum]